MPRQRRGQPPPENRDNPPARLERENFFYLILVILVIKNFYRIPYLTIDHLLSNVTELEPEHTESISNTVKNTMLYILYGFTFINAAIFIRLAFLNEAPRQNNIPANDFENIASPQNAIPIIQNQNRIYSIPETSALDQQPASENQLRSRYNPTLFSHSVSNSVDGNCDEQQDGENILTLNK